MSVKTLSAFHDGCDRCRVKRDLLTIWQVRPPSKWEAGPEDMIAYPEVSCANRAVCRARIEKRQARSSVRSKALILALPKNPGADRGHCRWCDKPIWKPGLVGVRDRRRNYHYEKHGEPDCITAWHDSKSYDARHVLFKRDKGICARCGHDAPTALKRFIAAEPKRNEFNEPRSPFTHSSSWPTAAEMAEAAGRYNVALKEFERAWPEDVRWEVDHIVPLEDGGDHVIENLQTLCRTCHRAKSAEEASARAARRRAA